MEEKFMNKRFNIYEKRFPRKPWNEAEANRTIKFLMYVMRRENEKAYDMYYTFSFKRNSTYHFTYDKFRRASWSDEEITSAIETLMKYGFLVKVDNNTANFYEDGNEELIASMMKESA